MSKLTEAIETLEPKVIEMREGRIFCGDLEITEDTMREKFDTVFTVFIPPSKQVVAIVDGDAEKLIIYNDVEALSDEEALQQSLDAIIPGMRTPETPNTTRLSISARDLRALINHSTKSYQDLDKDYPKWKESFGITNSIKSFVENQFHTQEDLDDFIEEVRE